MYNIIISISFREYNFQLSSKIIISRREQQDKKCPETKDAAVGGEDYFIMNRSLLFVQMLSDYNDTKMIIL